MKLWKKLTAAMLMGTAMLGAGLTAKPCLFLPAGAEITAQAADETVTVGYLTFTKKGTYVVLKECKQTVTQIDIPNKVDGLPVKGIGANAFKECGALTDITLPSTLKSIGNYAFFNHYPQLKSSE